jgi:integrase
MGRRIRDALLETRTARLRLPVRKKPYAGPLLARGVRQDYRRNKGAGSWVAKVANGHGSYWTKALKGVVADDFEDADGTRVLDFWQAQAAIRALASGKSGASGGRPATVEEALDTYRRHLQTQGGDPYNADRVRPWLPGNIAGKPVALLTDHELERWRAGLLADGMTPATANRITKGLRAALERAAKVDHRIVNERAWRIGLAMLPDAHNARHVILSDAEVRRLVDACRALDRHLGILAEVLAVTGARQSQVARLRVEDLQADQLRLQMPLSHKGGSRKKGYQRRSVPITESLAALLKQEAASRKAEAPLLRRDDGTPWAHSHNSRYRIAFRKAVEVAGLEPGTTLYSLRHAAITRMLLRGLPVRLTASLCDTSIAQIEAAYSRYIADHSDADALARATLLETGAEQGLLAKVVPGGMSRRSPAAGITAAPLSPGERV